MASVNSFLTRMPAGIPGDVNRQAAATIETQTVTPAGTSGAPAAYGLGLLVDNTGGNVGNMRTPLTTGDAAIYGLLVREYPTNSSQDALGTSTPPSSGPISVLVRGYMTVKLGGSAAAAKGGVLYLWVDTPSGAHALGQFEAASGSSSTIVVPGYFMGPADASGNVEIAFNI